MAQLYSYDYKITHLCGVHKYNIEEGGHVGVLKSRQSLVYSVINIDVLFKLLIDF